MAPIFAKIDTEILNEAKERLRKDFGVPGIRQFQEDAGLNILQGRHTILDVPTGGGKTLALWFALYYHIALSLRLGTQSKAIVVVISPLVALMAAQAESLNQRGIPAIALTSQVNNLVNEFQRVANGEYRVVLLGPEMQDHSDFKSIVLPSKSFLDNIIQFSVDEAHCISEWGSDFRPAYGQLIDLVRRLPNTVPQLIVSATLPKDVMDDVQQKLRLGDDFRVVSVSNRKPNIALSVRTMQHAQDTYADLVSLFPANLSSPDDLPQTIIYVNARTIAERVQDFLRVHAPPNLPSTAIKFYHRYLSDAEKADIERELRLGILRIVIATDALGMGIDLAFVRRVILWQEPQTFLSLIQKFGRCARNFAHLGEVILFITRASFVRHQTAFRHAAANKSSDVVADKSENNREDEQDESEDEAGLEPRGERQRQSREDAVDLDEEDSPWAASIGSGSGKFKKRKAISAIQRHDAATLSWFIATNTCRRNPWDIFFNNKDKLELGIDVPEGARCCDNCQPALFPVPRIVFETPNIYKPDRAPKPTDEQKIAVMAALKAWRVNVIKNDYPGQCTITGRTILDDDVLQAIANRARSVVEPRIFESAIPWFWSAGRDGKYGRDVVRIVQQAIGQFPDPADIVREEQRQARAYRKFKSLVAEDRKSSHKKLQPLFLECIAAVEALKDDAGNRICELFMRRPSSRKYPDYYEKIETPMSISNIRATAHSGPSKGYTSVAQFRDTWYLMFNNARSYNRPDSEIYKDTYIMQRFLDAKLVELFGEDVLLDDGHSSDRSTEVL